MSLGLIKPGMPGADLVRIHPKTGQIIEPLYVRENGSVVWPVLGAASDDPDDPAFTGEGDDGDEDDDNEDDEDEDDEPKPKKRPVKKAKSKKAEDDDEEEEDDDEDDRPTRPERQAARYRVKLRETEKALRDVQAELKAIRDKDSKPDEVATRDLTEARATVDKLTAQNRTLAAQLAFFTANTINWIDPADAFALAEREGLLEDVIDEDGTVDKRELRRGLRELAKRKKHLVKQDDSPKARGRKSTEQDEDEEDDDEEPSPRRSASSMNGSRRGKRGAAPSREQLAKKFPVLNKI